MTVVILGRETPASVVAHHLRIPKVDPPSVEVVQLSPETMAKLTQWALLTRPDDNQLKRALRFYRQLLVELAAEHNHDREVLR